MSGFDTALNRVSGIVTPLGVLVGVYYVVITNNGTIPPAAAPQQADPGIMAMTTPLWPYALIAVCAALLVTQWLRWLWARKERFTPSEKAFLKSYQTLKQVFNQTYENQTVHLDGKEFCECKFINCTLVFEGMAPVRFTNCGLEGEIGFGGLNPVIQNAVSIMSLIAARSGTQAIIKRLPTETLYPTNKGSS